MDPLRLSPFEIESITGIPAGQPVRQRNLLARAGIHSFINDLRELIVFHSWIDAAPFPKTTPSVDNPVEEDEDIGMDLEALGAAKSKP